MRIVTGTNERPAKYTVDGIEYCLFAEISALTGLDIKDDIRKVSKLILATNELIGHTEFICGKGGGHIWVSNAATKDRLILIEYKS
jgi:hypothetical protein